jgi:hypothetical protein
MTPSGESSGQSVSEPKMMRKPEDSRLLSEDHDEIKLVPQAVREIWSTKLRSAEADAWRDFLKTEEGRAWIRERGEAHRQ